MTRLTSRLSALTIAAAVALSGCSSAGDPQGAPTEGSPLAAASEKPSPEPSQDVPASIPASGPGLYEFTYMGATGLVTVPADVNDPRLAELEAYRNDVGAAPVTYFIAEVDNTQGSDEINMYSVVIITDEGQQIQTEKVYTFVSTWQDLVSLDDTATYNRGVDLHNSHLDNLLPGAKGDLILATTEPVPSVSRVYVYPAGAMEQVEASKASS